MLTHLFVLGRRGFVLINLRSWKAGILPLWLFISKFCLLSIHGGEGAMKAPGR